MESHMNIGTRFFLLLLAFVFVPDVFAMDLAPRLDLDLKIRTEKEQRQKQRMFENNIVQLVQAGILDPNACFESDARLLDAVCCFRSIKALLSAGANPALCTKPVLLHVLDYYKTRTQEKVFDIRFGGFVSRRDQFQERRLNKVIQSFAILLDAGVDPNKELYFCSPLEHVLILDSRCTFPERYMRRLLSLLIWHGANTDSAYDMAYRGRLEHRLFLRPPPSYYFLEQDSMKYKAVNQLLKSRHDASSYISWLPPEVLEQIIAYIKRLWFEKDREPVTCDKGFSRQPEETERKESPVDAAKKIAGSLELPPSDDSHSIEDELNPKQEKKIRKCFLPNSFLAIPSFIACGSVVVGISYWIYRTWRHRQIRKKKERKRLWEEYHRNRTKKSLF